MDLSHTNVHLVAMKLLLGDVFMLLGASFSSPRTYRETIKADIIVTSQ